MMIDSLPRQSAFGEFRRVRHSVIGMVSPEWPATAI